MPQKLSTINAEELLSFPLPPIRFIIDGLLPQGLHILAGAPKIGKSWLALTLCLCVAKGEPLWSFAAQQCSVLYLCLEDSYQRIRCRLLDLTEDAPDTLHFSIIAEQLHGGHALLEHHQRVLRGVELHLAAALKARELHRCRGDLEAFGSGFFYKFHSQSPSYQNQTDSVGPRPVPAHAGRSWR